MSPGRDRHLRLLVAALPLLAVACGKRTTVSEKPAAAATAGVAAAQGPAPRAQPTSEPAVRLPARRLDAILNESERYYGRGMQAYQSGRLTEANRAFNDAIDVILRSGYSLDENIELVEQIERILTGIVDFELNRTSEEFVSQHSEPQSSGPVGGLEAKLPAPASSSFPLVRNDQVDHFIRLFQTRRDRRAQIEGGLRRAGRYLDSIREVLRAEGLPEELAYVPMVESAYKTFAYSRARAKGLWQFMAPTGTKFGLNINWWIDERSDPEKATRAAVQYLKFLYQTFGDWHLAIAAYNCGEERVERAIERTGKRDFWELARTHALPRETKEFVPQILAAVWIARDPMSFGFRVEPEPPLRYDTVLIDGSIDLQLVARCLGVGLEEVRELNPELRRGITPRDARGYRLKLPAGRREQFLASLATVPEEQRASYQRYVVQRGDSLARIASRFDVPLEDLVKANRLANIHTIGVGESLLIPSLQAMRVAASSNGHGAPSSSGVPADDHRTEETSESMLTHRVNRGDTLYMLARRYGTSIDQLRALNRLPRSRTLQPGMVLVVRRDSQDDDGNDQADKLTYKVRRGDTLSKIARSFGASITDLARWNNLDDVGYLLPGMLLTIYR